jgi:uncharacterized protein (TIGR02099 family)
VFRRTKTLLWTAFSILVILAAVLVGIGKLMMPYSERYQPQLEDWLSQEFGQPVVLDSFEGEWAAFGPRLTLRGMKLLPVHPEPEAAAPGATPEVVIESAALDIKPLNALLPGMPLYNFRVIGAHFELHRGESGQFRLSGFGVSRRGDSQGRSALGDLARVGDVVLQDSSLTYRDDRAGVDMSFSGIQGRLHLEGDELSAEVQAQLFDSQSELVYGDVEATVLLNRGDDQKFRHAKWQATTRELMLAALQGKLPANPFLPVTGWLNAELWGEWSAGEGHRIKGVADLKEARLANEHQNLWVERLNTRFNWRYAGRRHWTLHLADFSYDDGQKAWTAPRVSMARDTDKNLGLWISADRLPLGIPLNLTRDVLSVYGTPWPAFLPKVASGQVSDLDLVLDDRWRVEFASGSVSGASVSDWDRRPDLAGLDGDISLHRGGGRIQLHGKRVVVDWPRMFRQPIAAALPECTLDLSWSDEPRPDGGRDWQTNFRACRAENEDAAAQGDVLVNGNGGKPAVDVNVAVTRADAGRLDPYWPEALLPDPVKHWLRNGLVAGTLRSGRLQIVGDMDDWPFRQGEGRFEAIADVQGMKLHYLDGWPDATGVDAVARFVGVSMDVRGQVAEIGGAEARSASATIADFSKAVLTVSYEADNDLPGFLGFLRQTPLYDRIGADLTRYEFSGPAATRGTIRVPLGKSPGELSVLGSVAVSEGRFYDPSSEVAVEGIRGELTYNETGFRGSGLDATYQGATATLDLLADSESDERFRADLRGTFEVGTLIPPFLLDEFRAFENVQGSSPWIVSLVVGAANPGQQARAALEVRSDLEGVEMALPAPLDKPAGARWPMALRYPLNDGPRVLNLELLDRATIRLKLGADDGSPLSSAIRLGGGFPSLPPDGSIRVEGDAPEIDLDGWIDVIVDEVANGAGLGNLDLEDGSLGTGRLVFLDRSFADVSMNFSMAGPEIRGDFHGEDIEGKMRFTSGESGMSSLSAEMERLALGEPLSSGMDVDTDPSELPALHLYAKSFRYAGIELGETRIEAYPSGTGFHFEKVDAASDRMSVKASGDWLRDENGQRSDFNIHITSESLGNLLESMGISSPVQGGQTIVGFNAWWPGSPGQFALSRLNGKVEFSVVDGNITQASAGTGRLLGLLSVQALPKRLALDFRDVFDSGFPFDQATGTFEMKNGTATTDDVLLKSSVATISVTGSTDLVARQYDQLLTVRPGVGNTLPIIGALAAGPGGAAAGLALQGLLHEQLAEATQVQYTVTGSWDDPKVEAVQVQGNPAQKEDAGASRN